jgi:hypothetical protein
MCDARRTDIFATMYDHVKGVSENADVPAMYVRNVPEALLRQVRAQAALDGETMRDFVLRAVREELRRRGIEVPDEEDD